MDARIILIILCIHSSQDKFYNLLISHCLYNIRLNVYS